MAGHERAEFDEQQQLSGHHFLSRCLLGTAPGTENERYFFIFRNRKIAGSAHRQAPFYGFLAFKISTTDRTHARNRNAKDTETKPNTQKDRTQAHTETHVSDDGSTRAHAAQRSASANPSRARSSTPMTSGSDSVSQTWTCNAWAGGPDALSMLRTQRRQSLMRSAPRTRVSR